MIEFKDKIDEAVSALRGYCAKVKTCQKCRFVAPDGQCPFMQETPPCDWDMDGSGLRFINRWSKAKLRAEK